MKRLILVALLCATMPIFGSTPTATVSDKDGTVWNNCTYTATLTIPGGTGTPAPTVGGVTVSPLVVTGSCNSSGAIAPTLTDTSTVDQPNAQWVFKVQSNTSDGPVTVSTPVVGSAPNLTSSFSLLRAPRFATGANAYGYTDGEVQGIPNLGATYYNVTTRCLRQYSQSGWTCGSGSLLPAGVSVDAEWPFNDGAGTTVKDISGDGHDGTFGTGSNAPTWASYGVNFNANSTWTATIPQVVKTNITSWSSIIIAHCVYPGIQTNGIASPAIPYAVYPALFGSSTADGFALVGTASSGSPAGQSSGAFRPASSQILGGGGNRLSLAADGFGQCQTTAMTLGATDAYYENGVAVPMSVSGSSASVVASAGGYEFGGDYFSTVSAYRGVISYAIASIGTVWTPLQVQQLNNYIQSKLASRTMPVYPNFNRVTANQLLVVGDSIVSGYEGTAVWTTKLALNNTYTVSNWGLDGINAYDNSRLAESRWESSIAPSAARNLVLFEAGTNDVSANSYSAADAWASIALQAQKARSVGAIPIVATIISRTGKDSFIAPLNVLIRAGWKQAGFAALMDDAEDPVFAAGASTNTTYYNADGTHLTGLTACDLTTGYGHLCVNLSKITNTLDGSSASAPDTTTSNAFVATDANNYVIQTPTAAATYTLVPCQAITGQVKTIVNGSASNAITVSPTSPDTIIGSATIAAGASGSFTAVNSSPTAGGCNWVRYQ